MRTLALIKRIMLEMLRDKRTLALLFLAPLLVLTIMYFFFNGDTVQPKLGIINIDKRFVKMLDKADIDIKRYNTAEQPKQIVLNEHLDGLLQKEEDKYILTLQNSDPSSAKALQMKVKQAISAQAQQQLIKHIPVQVQTAKQNVETKYVYGNSNTAFFDVLSPILVGFFVFFFVFLISGIGLLKERTSGTLDRLMATPLRRWEIVTAYLVGFGIFAIIQTIIIVLYSVNVLDMVVIGSIWNVILINLLLALVALSLGTLLSTFAASEFQMVQFIPIVAIPQVFFAGIFPLEGMADWLQTLAKVMPIYYGADALKGVMYKGLTLIDIGNALLALSIFAIVFIILNILALKRYRKL